MNARVTRWAKVSCALTLLVGAVHCSSSAPSSSSSQGTKNPKEAPNKESPPAASPSEPAKPIPNPEVVEDTPTYYVQRYKKADMVRVDETHVRLPFMRMATTIYREDADYYYVLFEKRSKEEIDASIAARKKSEDEAKARSLAAVEEAAKTSPLVVTPEQFNSLPAIRGDKQVVFRRAGEGLPKDGQWRQNIAVADMNGDGIADIVTGPARIAKSTIHVFLGDGHGAFREEPLDFVDEKGNPATNLRFDYGGVAVADFDGDGKNDVALASHQGSVRVFLNRGAGKFAIIAGQPPYSSQGIAAFDVNGDGKTDLVVSRDTINNGARHQEGKDYHQVRVFFNDGHGKFHSDDDAIRGACFSYNVFPIDLTGSGKRDLLTGCRFLGGWGLTWKNDGKGKFENELFEIIEQSAYHYAVAPGSFGPNHATAFADLYDKQIKGSAASGLNVYYKDPEGWHKIAVWRQNRYPGRLSAVAMGDLDGDGLDDIVFPDRIAKKIRIFYQTKDGKFVEGAESAEPALDSVTVDVRLADLTGDHRLDIVLAKSVFTNFPKDPGGIEVLLNEGSGAGGAREPR
jgi:hypothetical protein